MKLTTLLLIVSIFSAQANGYAQNTKITLDLENVRIQTVLENIESLTDFKFLYNNKKIDAEKIVSVKATKKRVSEILDDMFKDLGISYIIKRKQIILKIRPIVKAKDTPKTRSVTVAKDDVQLQVNGTITEENGGPLPGASVVEKGTTNGTQTDFDGNYTIAIGNDDAILVISYIGYATKEISVNGQSRIDVALQPETSSLDEVVIVGYGTTKRSALTGAVSSVKEEDIELVNAVNIDNMLQGKIPGVNIGSFTAQPGANTSITIRGAISPRGNNTPLYVIDGVPILNNGNIDSFGNAGTTLQGGVNRNPLNSINPNDIASVDVLKDASASAIYGSAAANGVILITTKRGSTGDAKVSYSVNYSFQNMKDFIEPLNATDFTNLANLWGEEQYKLTNGLDIYGTTDPTTVDPYNPFFSEADIAAAGQGTDWMDYITRTGQIAEHNISVSGGTEKTKYFASFNYFDQKGIIATSGMQRISGRMNLDQKVGSAVTVKLGVTYSEIVNDNEGTGAGDADSPSIIQSALRFAPTFGPFDENGNLTQSYATRVVNPQAYFLIKNQTKTTRLLFNPTIEFQLHKDLKLSFVGGFDTSRATNNLFIPVSAQIESDPNGTAQIATNEFNNYTGESFFTYNKSFGKNYLSAVLGVGYYNNINNGNSLITEGFFTDALGTDDVGLSSDVDNTFVDSYRNENTKQSQFTRINYTYDDRYNLTLNARRDGSSIWAEGNKWGIFLGISGAWNISNEKFFPEDSFISTLKLRGGYGEVGNEGLQGNFSRTLYASSQEFAYPFGTSGTLNPGVVQTQQGNPDLTWETDISTNIALDFGLFNDRITGSVDVYRITAKDLFDFQTLPAEGTVGQIGANIGSTRSEGIDIALRTLNVATENFTWTTDWAFATNRSYWVERNPEVELADFIGENDDITAAYGWKTDGLIRSEADIPDYQTGANLGNIKYVDHNNDGVLDSQDVVKLGVFAPKGSFSIGNTFVYKGFDLNIYAYGTYGGFQQDQFSAQFTKNIGPVSISATAPSNTDQTAKKVYTTFNPDGIYAGIAADPFAGNNPTGFSDFQSYTMSFLRLRNVTLGYTLPSDIPGLNKFISSMRIFLDFQNLGFLSNQVGFDPEMERGNFPYPTAGTISFGLNVDF